MSVVSLHVSETSLLDLSEQYVRRQGAWPMSRSRRPGLFEVLEWHLEKQFWCSSAVRSSLNHNQRNGVEEKKKITWRGVERSVGCRRLDSCTASCSFSRSTPGRTNRILLQQSQTFSDKSLAHLVIYGRFAVMYLQTKYYNYISVTYYYRYDVPWRCCRQLQRRGALWRQPELLHCPDVGARSVYRSCCPCSTPKKHKLDCKWALTVQGFKVFQSFKNVYTLFFTSFTTCMTLQLMLSIDAS